MYVTIMTSTGKVTCIFFINEFNYTLTYVHFFPVAYALLTTKREPEYKRMFTALKELRPSVKPDRLMMDFEKAVRNPAEEILKVSDIAGCWFHFRQATMKKRKALKLNLKNENIRKAADMLDALAFLPLGKVTRGIPYQTLY